MLLFIFFSNVVLGNLFGRGDRKDGDPNLVPSNSTHALETPPTSTRKKRNLPGNPDIDAEVIALSPEHLMATNRFICEFCQKGFQREQNMHLHKRTHKVEYELKRGRSREIRKKVYVCPNPTCKHHHPSSALRDLTAIKKHYSRKHGEKIWNCEKCSKVYAVESDLKSHFKKCGTCQYKCHCGVIFSRKDSFWVHKYRCFALEQESGRITDNTLINPTPTPQVQPILNQSRYISPRFSSQPPPHHHNEQFYSNQNPMWYPVPSNPTPLALESQTFPNFLPTPQGHLSAPSLNPNAVSFGTQMVGHVGPSRFNSEQSNSWDFLGKAIHNGTTSQANMGMSDVPSCSGMELYQDYLNYLEEGGDGFGFGAGPSRQ